MPCVEGMSIPLQIGNIFLRPLNIDALPHQKWRRSQCPKLTFIGAGAAEAGFLSPPPLILRASSARTRKSAFSTQSLYWSPRDAINDFNCFAASPSTHPSHSLGSAGGDSDILTIGGFALIGFPLFCYQDTLPDRVYKSL
jgi:hypothetical protein